MHTSLHAKMKQNDKFYIDEFLQSHMHQYRLCLLHYDCFYKGNNLCRGGGGWGSRPRNYGGFFFKKRVPKLQLNPLPAVYIQTHFTETVL